MKRQARELAQSVGATRTVHARQIFTVGSAVYTPSTKPSPQKSPERAGRPQVSGGAEVLKQQPSSPGTPATQVSSEQVKAMSLQSTDDLAVKLAEQVVRGGSKAKPALVMALQSAFGVLSLTHGGIKYILTATQPVVVRSRKLALERT